MLKRFLLGLFLLILLWGATQEAQAVVRISDDRGGRIKAYILKYEWLRIAGEKIVIDGMCASACTLVLGIIPPDKLCATSQASFGFHQGYNLDYAASGMPVQTVNPEATKLMSQYYPASIAHWIRRHKGLPPPEGMLWLKGPELAQLVPTCGNNTY
jgi:hypothetical protein